MERTAEGEKMGESFAGRRPNSVEFQDLIRAVRRQADADMRAAYQRWGREAFHMGAPTPARRPRSGRMRPALHEAITYLEVRGPMTALELADALTITEDAARTRIRDLLRSGAVTRVGAGYPRKYAAAPREAKRHRGRA